MSSRLSRFFTNLFALVDIVTVSIFDIDRELVHAAKVLVWRRNDHCDGTCDACDGLIFVARERCRELRRLQQVQRNVLSPYATMVLVMARGLGR